MISDDFGVVDLTFFLIRLLDELDLASRECDFVLAKKDERFPDGSSFFYTTIN